MGNDIQPTPDSINLITTVEQSYCVHKKIMGEKRLSTTMIATNFHEMFDWTISRCRMYCLTSRDLEHTSWSVPLLFP